MAVHSFLARRVVRRSRQVRAAFDPLFADDLEAILAGFFGMDGRGGVGETVFDPRVDVSGGPDDLVLAVELPGLQRGDVEVTVDGDDLTLRGEKKIEPAKASEGYLHAERTPASFSHTFRIPFEVEADAVRCRFRDGLLTIAVPWPPESQAQPRTVPVTTG